MFKGWRSKYRTIAEQLAGDLDDARLHLEAETSKRIAAETLAAERKSEMERIYQMLATAEASRDKAIQSVDTMNAKLLQAITPEKEVSFRKQPQANGEGAPMVAMKQQQRQRLNQADAMYAATIKLQEQQRDKARAAKLAQAQTTQQIPPIPVTN